MSPVHKALFLIKVGAAADLQMANAGVPASPEVLAQEEASRLQEFLATPEGALFSRQSPMKEPTSSVVPTRVPETPG